MISLIKLKLKRCKRAILRQTHYRRLIIYRKKIQEHRLYMQTSEHERFTLTLGTLGGLVLVWARIEHLIDIWVSIVHYEWGQINIQENLPPSLDRELDYLRKSVKGWPEFSSVAIHANQLIYRIHEPKGFRHDIVHGEIDMSDFKQIEVLMQSVKGSKRLPKTTRYTTDQILEKTDKIRLLHHDLSEFVSVVAKAFVDAHEMGRPFAMTEVALSVSPGDPPLKSG